MRKFRARDSEKIFFSFFLSFEQREIDLSERMANITRFKTTWSKGHAMEYFVKYLEMSDKKLLNLSNLIIH